MNRFEEVAKNLNTCVMVCSSNTGEILHEFTGVDLMLGKQYWTAWCVRQYYTIDEIDTACDGHVTYWVH